jgi:hypothetical protein
MMKLCGGTLFQKDQMDAREFLKQANLYEEIDSNMLDRVYKTLVVTPLSHPLTIVRAREIINWAETRGYNDILEGRYPRKPGATGAASNGAANGSASDGGAAHTTPNARSSAQLIHCPHCGREQMNRRFCSLCGGVIS